MCLPEYSQMEKRKQIRLPGFDYSEPRYYFVTICTQHKKHLFGRINNAEMVLNDVGNMISHWWEQIPNKYSHIILDAFQIMPNHIHAIIQITNHNVGVDQNQFNPHVDPNKNEYINSINNRRTHRSAPTVGDIIQWVKTMSTNEYIRNVKTNNWPTFTKRIWQRNYYEHIIRNEENLNEIREYVKTNPQNWDSDENNV